METREDTDRADASSIVNIGVCGEENFFKATSEIASGTDTLPVLKCKSTYQQLYM